MHAAVIDEHGPPSVLHLRAVPVPEPAPNEVLIEVHAAGVGSWDAKVREGGWAEDGEDLPRVLGADGAGIVAAKGSRVRRFNVGDPVYAYEFENPKGGFYAEYAAVNAQHVGPVPETLDLLHAGTAAVTGLTALQGISGALRVRQGNTVLIFGASGAVGTLAVQFAKARGARVIATATGEEATRLLESLGADVVFDARDANELERLERLVPDGIDAALVLASGETLERVLDLMRNGGRVAYPNGVEPTPRQRPTFRLQGYDAVASPEHFKRLNAAIEEAQLQAPTAAVFPLTQITRAHERLERGHVAGRIVLQVRNG
jgi:NADPH2:quinone reductase